MKRRDRLLFVCVLVALTGGVIALAGCGAGPGERARVAACTGADAVDFGCQQRRYVALAKTTGARAALRDLGAALKGGGYVGAACHQLAHRIGRTAGATAGIAAFEQGDPLCGSGFYHGVTEATMTKRGAAAAVRDAAGVCGPLRAGGRFSADYATCVHGMGHGFMGVLERDIVASLKGCDGLRAAGEREGCYSGVFMENLSTVDHPDAQSLRPAQPFYPCTAVGRRYKEQCYDRQSTYALFVNDGDFATVFKLCAKAEPGFAGACRRGLGGDVAAETKQVDGRAAQARSRRALCMLPASTRARVDCVTGAVDVILQDLDGGPAQLDAFCAAFEAVATQPQHAACLQASEQAYRALLAQQTGQDPKEALPAGGPGFVCHLKTPRGREAT